MTNTPTEQPEDKDLQDHTFGQKVAEKTEEAERRAAEDAPLSDAKETEHHAGGKA